MDMDIPLPEELELLEANSHYYDEPCLDPSSPDPYSSSAARSPDSPPSASPEINGQKRPRHSVDSESPSDENKRAKIIDVDENAGIQIDDDDDEEDWLRYSPPPQDSNTTVAGVQEEIYLSRYASAIDGDFLPVTAPSSGDRVYARVCRVECELRTKKLDVTGQSNDLISEPFDVLLQRIEQQAFNKALQASSEHQSDEIVSETPIVHERLWVEKYAPNSFTELLSDEHTNREVLLWLKQWDSCVFGSEIRSTSDEVLSSLRRHTSAQHHKYTDSSFSSKSRGRKWSSGSYRNSNNLDHGNTKGIQDPWSKKSRLTGPPEHKILLLCGSPGLGKTTLAHVAAKHCGYRVVEINASDDRSSSTIEAKILDVVQMNSVMADSRPKCLVIDEIDGALGDGKGAVDVLLKMVSAEKKPDTGKENISREEKSRRSKKGHKNASLSRPVICICNDLYAPALRPLRQVAKVHIFVQPTVSRVVSRLKYICNKEGMKTSSIALTALAEYTDCDIRSCLNTLQFLNKKKEALNVMEISSQVVGRKDISRSAFDIWKEIFQKRKVKQEKKSYINCGSSSGEFDFLHSLITNCGGYDIILDGVHENFLQLRYHDPVMQKTVKCLNYLGVSDLMHQYIMRTQQMPLLVYQPSLAISLHRLLAQVQKPNIEWPKSYQRYRTISMEKMDILRAWHQKIAPHISRHLSTELFVEDLISPLLHILSPTTLRPVALHLLSEKEKNDLAQLVNVMVSYSITYKSIKSDPLPSNLSNELALDVSALSFHPPINDFIHFKDHRSDHHVLSLAMKQVLLHEVEKQKILQLNTGRSENITDEPKKEEQTLVHKEATTADSAKITVKGEGSGRESIENTMNIPNTKQGNPSTSINSSSWVSNRCTIANAKAKTSGNSRKPSGGFNFFDRFRKTSSKNSQDADTTIQKEAPLERDLRPLLFKFNEGFTNAIKRPVRMREFFQ
ncbi:hypothetical protein SLE2022_153820 [Rubroshorea leprosula]